MLNLRFSWLILVIIFLICFVARFIPKKRGRNKFAFVIIFLLSRLTIPYAFCQQGWGNRRNADRFVTLKIATVDDRAKCKEHILSRSKKTVTYDAIRSADAGKHSIPAFPCARAASFQAKFDEWKRPHYLTQTARSSKYTSSEPGSANINVQSLRRFISKSEQNSYTQCISKRRRQSWARVPHTKARKKCPY